MSPSPRSRLLNLDLLRFVAVALVVSRHLGVPPTSLGWPRAIHELAMALERGGWVGVDLFFVLSGFLVSGLLFTEYLSHQRVTPLHFYVRRGWKIYPSFWCLLAVSAVLLPATGWPYSRQMLTNELLFIQNYRAGLWNHTWSLAVEEHFYLLLPLLFWVVIAIGRRRQATLRPVLYVAACLSVLMLVARIAHWRAFPVYTHSDHLFPTHLRLDSLMFGVALAYGYYMHPDRFVAMFAPWRLAFVGLGAACFIPAFVWPLGSNAFVFTAGLTLFQVGAGMLLVSALLLPAPSGVVLKTLAAIGAYSYSIYLWHLAVIIHFVPFALRFSPWPIPLLGRVLLTFVAAMAFGVVMAKIIEMPALALRDRWFPSRSRPLGIPARPRPAAAGADRRVAV